MQRPQHSLVGSIVERPSKSLSSPSPAHSISPSGFPSVQHRSKSAFARAREARRDGSEEPWPKRPREVPIVRSTREAQAGFHGHENGGSVQPGAFLTIFP